MINSEDIDALGRNARTQTVPPERLAHDLHRPSEQIAQLVLDVHDVEERNIRTPIEADEHVHITPFVGPTASDRPEECDVQNALPAKCALHRAQLLDDERPVHDDSLGVNDQLLNQPSTRPPPRFRSAPAAATAMVR
jgi:hypothetical protein